MNIRILIMSVAMAATAGAVWAKMPPLTDEQKTKMAETKAKADEAAKKDADLLAKSQDKVVANYKKSKGIKPGPTAKKK